MSSATRTTTLNTNPPTRVPNSTLQRTSWTTQHALSSDHLPIITTIKIRHDYRHNKSDGLSPTTRKLTGHNSRFRSDHHTHQHTHRRYIFYKHTDGEQAQHAKRQDAQHVHALNQPHNMQNHTKKQHTERNVIHLSNC